MYLVNELLKIAGKLDHYLKNKMMSSASQFTSHSVVFGLRISSGGKKRGQADTMPTFMLLVLNHLQHFLKELSLPKHCTHLEWRRLIWGRRWGRELRE